ncbi:MAG: hypothetical protein GC154_09535 [bacterium]|nr:hypothetical protein [bacterium]
MASTRGRKYVLEALAAIAVFGLFAAALTPVFHRAQIKALVSESMANLSGLILNAAAYNTATPHEPIQEILIYNKLKGAGFLHAGALAAPAGVSSVTGWIMLTQDDLVHVLPSLPTTPLPLHPEDEIGPYDRFFAVGTSAARALTNRKNELTCFTRDGKMTPGMIYHSRFDWTLFPFGDQVSLAGVTPGPMLPDPLTADTVTRYDPSNGVVSAGFLLQVERAGF